MLSGVKYLRGPDPVFRICGSINSTLLLSKYGFHLSILVFNSYISSLRLCGDTIHLLVLDVNFLTQGRAKSLQATDSKRHGTYNVVKSTLHDYRLSSIQDVRAHR